MDKPTLFTREPIMDYHSMVAFIEKKYDVNLGNYIVGKDKEDKEDHFVKYQRITGDKQPNDGHYPDMSAPTLTTKNSGHTVVRNGERRPSTKEEYDADIKLIHKQYQRYKDWSKDNPKPPYLNYWHWMVDNEFHNLSNGSEQYWHIEEILDDEYSESPSWVKEITQLFYDEFKEQLDKDGGINVLVSW